MQKESNQQNLQRRKQFEQYLEKQKKQREQAINQKKKQLQLNQNPLEKMLFIQKEFRTKQEQLDKQIVQYKQKKIQYNQVIHNYNELKNYYLSISYALNTYDRQTYKQTLQKLLNTIMQLKKKFEPRKKFKFSRRNQDFGVIIQHQEIKETLKQGYQDSIAGLSQLRDLNLIVQSQELSKSYKIIKSSNLNIQLRGITEILFLKELKNCIIRAGPTKSTVFVDNCQNCTFQLSCHQLRIHNTKNTKFGIFVSSKPIIEDTSQVIFKKYNYKYAQLENDEQICGLKEKQNLWNQIQDFNWLKQQISPNFTIVDGDEFI